MAIYFFFANSKLQLVHVSQLDIHNQLILEVNSITSNQYVRRISTPSLRVNVYIVPFIAGGHQPLRSSTRTGQKNAAGKSLCVQRDQNPERISGQRLSELCHAHEQKKRCHCDVAEVSQECRGGERRPFDRNFVLQNPREETKHGEQAPLNGGSRLEETVWNLS